MINNQQLQTRKLISVCSCWLLHSVHKESKVNSTCGTYCTYGTKSMQSNKLMMMILCLFAPGLANYDVSFTQGFKEKQNFCLQKNISRNKHLESLWILLWFRAVRWWEESSQFILLGLKSGGSRVGADLHLTADWRGNILFNSWTHRGERGINRLEGNSRKNRSLWWMLSLVRSWTKFFRFSNFSFLIHESESKKKLGL